MLGGPARMAKFVAQFVGEVQVNEFLNIDLFREVQFISIEAGDEHVKVTWIDLKVDDFEGKTGRAIIEAVRERMATP
jgi:hypothetical protein